MPRRWRIYGQHLDRDAQFDSYIARTTKKYLRHQEELAHLVLDYH